MEYLQNINNYIALGLHVGLVVCVFLAIVVGIVGILKLLAFRRLFTQPAAYLELTPPATTNVTPESSQRLFAVLHGMQANRSLKDKLLLRRACFSFEIVSTKARGIRYIIRVAESDTANVEKVIISYFPDIKIRHVDDYLPRASSHHIRILTFKQTGHFAYPLQGSNPFERTDPMTYITGAMTKLSPDDMVAFQLVATPTKVREARIIAAKLLSNNELVGSLGKRRRLSIVGGILTAISSVLFSFLEALGDMVSTPTQSAPASQKHQQHQQEVAMKLKPARILTKFEQDLAESVHSKLRQPLFQVSVRVMVVTHGTSENQRRTKALRESMTAFTVPGYQSLKAGYNFLYAFRDRHRLAGFRQRLPALTTSNILSASELADLYHFPNPEVTTTENLIKSHSRTLPAPVSLKQDKHLDVIIGENAHHNEVTLIGLTEQERERHEYIIGGTGNGKTTMLQYQIVQDMLSGKGLAIVDPHGDMAETILHHVPPERVKDVIYFNPDDLEYPIGLNLLELTPGLTGNELLREKDTITESVVSVFRKIFSDDDSGGHRIEYVLRNTVQTALAIEGATLFTVFDLLNDPKYRKTIIKTLEDKNLINFWKNELGKAGDMQKVKMAAGITAKIGRFLFSASARQILEQPRSTIDFDDIINSGKILICNFSKGLLGEDTSELFGITVLAKLQLASLRRARLKQSERRPFYLYVDEFQNFATSSFVQMLSESRKYKLLMVMAEQSTSQQDDQQMVNIILANVGTVICFRTGNPQDERSLLPLFSPSIDQGEISNLPAFNFYAKLSAVQSQEPLSGQTLLLKDDGSDEVAAAIVEHSRMNFAKKQETEQKIAETVKPATTVVEKSFKEQATTSTKPKMLDV
jgi:hypothetical protein